jgi:hypothetical protein
MQLIHWGPCLQKEIMVALQSQFLGEWAFRKRVSLMCELLWLPVSSQDLFCTPSHHCDATVYEALSRD